jgi:hypothetical protein
MARVQFAEASAPDITGVPLAAGEVMFSEPKMNNKAADKKKSFLVSRFILLISFSLKLRAVKSANSI